MSLYDLRLQEQMQEAREIAKEGLYCDGAHHKQWYLEQIIEALGEELPPETLAAPRGTAP